LPQGVFGFSRLSVRTIAVIGATATGCAFAAAAAAAGYVVVLEDVSREMRDSGIASIAILLQDRRECGALSEPASAVALRNISTALTVETAIRDAQLIIEAVPEELEMKLELFTIFDKFAKPGAIFISTSEKLSILDISDVTTARDRCMGMRFTRTSSGEHVLEVVPTALTSPETLRICRGVAERLSKNVRAVQDSGPA
jgi:3-hydroxyacyl-CoA dehydrogenase